MQRRYRRCRSGRKSGLRSYSTPRTGYIRQGSDNCVSTPGNAVCSSRFHRFSAVPEGDVAVIDHTEIQHDLFPPPMSGDPDFPTQPETPSNSASSSSENYAALKKFTESSSAEKHRQVACCIFMQNIVSFSFMSFFNGSISNRTPSREADSSPQSGECILRAHSPEIPFQR